MTSPVLLPSFSRRGGCEADGVVTSATLAPTTPPVQPHGGSWRSSARMCAGTSFETPANPPAGQGSFCQALLESTPSNCNRFASVPIPAPMTTGQATDCAHAHGASARMRWARWFERVFDIDIERCPPCRGHLKIIAAIEEHAVMERILAHLGLCAQPQPRPPARRAELFQAACPSNADGFWPGLAG